MGKSKEDSEPSKEVVPDRSPFDGWETDPRYDNAQKEQVLELWEELGEDKVRAIVDHQRMTLSQIRSAIKGDA